jgi:Emfourin
MQIKFARSGGLAGAATNVTGTVQWTDRGVQVTAEGTDYRRDLPPAEAQQLEGQADPSALTRVRRDSSSTAAVRDAFQYNITVITRDGKAHLFTFTGVAAPSEGSLLAWVEQEARKIWKFRANQRK